VVVLWVYMKILITGAGSGIGHDAAIALARNGHAVLATTHTEEQRERLSKDAEMAGVSLEAAKLDITSAEDVAKYSSREIDVLINNAGQGESGPICEIPLERFREGMEVNVFGTVRMTQAFVPHMVKRRSGRVIIVSSIAGRLVTPYLGPYSMTKFALESMGDALRLELKPHRIKVSLIEPGLIYTGFNEEMAASKYEWLKEDSVMAKYVPKMKAREETLKNHSFPTEPVVESIIHAVEARRPKTRYITPKSYALSVKLLRIIPDRMKDFIARKVSGL
jgi:short-subunit dehydrogenase